MSEERTYVKTSIVDKRCPLCGLGKMRQTTGEPNPATGQWPHACTNKGCTCSESYPKTYPYVDYQKLDA